MHHIFTPSCKKGQEFQLFLPFNCILNSNQEGSQNTNNQEMSITTEVALNLAGSDNLPDKIRDEQAAAFEKSRREAYKQRAKRELELDDRDIDFYMIVDTQKKILDEIEQQKRGNQQPPGGVSSHKSKPSDGAHQVYNQLSGVNRQQMQNLPADNNQHPEPNQERNADFRCPADASPILRAGEMAPPHSQSQQVQHPNTDSRFHGNERWQPEHYHPGTQYADPAGTQYQNSAGTQYPHASESQYPQTAVGTNQQQPYPISQVGNRQPPAVYNQPHRNVHQIQGQPPYQAYHVESQHDQYGQPYQGGNNAYMQASGTNHPQQAAPYQPPIANQSGNYQTHQPYNAAAQPVNKNPHNLGIGSLVQYDTCTGVIKWMDDHIAGLEMVITVVHIVFLCVCLPYNCMCVVYYPYLILEVYQYGNFGLYRYRLYFCQNLPIPITDPILILHISSNYSLYIPCI